MKIIDICTEKPSTLKVKTRNPTIMIGFFAKMIDKKYPKAETAGYQNLTNLINKEFNTSFTYDDIVNYYQTSIDILDVSTWYKINFGEDCDDN